MNNIVNERWENLLENWVKSNNYNKVYFIITKKCGYEFLVTVYKKQTLKELYEIVKLELDNKNKIMLYIEKNNINVLENNDSNIKNWISDNRSKLEITTLLPNPVAYRLWLDE
tara:strand:- start:10848 stop:11186 length:339 start_codon:yes stop_codon:yes gene_type:complete